MDIYYVDFDTINHGWFQGGYEEIELAEVIEEVKEELFYAGGGHADIYDEAGDFVEDVEV